MKVITFASLALTVALTSAYVIPGQKWTPENKRSPMVVSGVGFDETGAAISPKRDAEAFVVPGAPYNEDAEEKRSFHDGTWKREAEADAEAEEKRSFHDGTWKRDADAEAEDKRSFHDGTWKRDAEADAEAEEKRGYQDGTW